MNPVSVLLLENPDTQGYCKVEGIPEITWEDSGFSSSGSHNRCYLAARLIHGDISQKTIERLQEHLWYETARMVQRNRWDVPVGSEIYRLLCDLALIEHSAGKIKSDEVRLIVLQRLTELRKPKAPYNMHPRRWNRWRSRYAEIVNELTYWADVHLAYMGRRLN